MYQVVITFKDLQDDGHVYKVGDVFPREGHEVSDERITELSSTDNKRGVVLIKEVKKESKEVAPKRKKRK